MKSHRFILIFLLGATVTGCASHRQMVYNRQPAPEILFMPHPPMPCEDKEPVKDMLRHLRPGAVYEFPVSQHYAWVRTRVDTLKLSRTEVPTLTVATDLSAAGNSLSNEIDIVGGSGTNWMLHLCAEGGARTKEQASSYIQDVSLKHDGGLITLDGPGPNRHGRAFGTLRVDAPEAAPIMVMDPSAAVRVRGVGGPVWVNTARGRTTILNTTGNVDASGEFVDFAGSKGSVRLNADEINVKLTGRRFDGKLQAVAQHSVRVLLPVDFETPIRVTVKRRNDFVCRAKLCSAMRRRTVPGWYIYTYAGAGSEHAGRVKFVSSRATVVIDNWK